VIEKGFITFAGGESRKSRAQVVKDYVLDLYIDIRKGAVFDG
jgi:hypothetical protein